MKAMLIKNYGSPEVFEYGEIYLRPFKENEIFVKVKSSGVNPVDAGIRRGLLKSFIHLKLPAVLGVDVAGVVEKTGKTATRFNPGDKVYAFMGLKNNGGYGEYINIPERFAALSPVNLSMDEAGSVPGVGLTALEAFSIHAPVKRGMKVLINGASGGVGTYGIQIAKHFGAIVTAVCATRNLRLAKQLGADEVVDYTNTDILGIASRFDVILNCVRETNNIKFEKLLLPHGTLIVIAGNTSEILLLKFSNLFTSKKVKMFFVKPSGIMLQQLTELIEMGVVKPVIDTIYSWKDLKTAHEQIEQGKVTGKIAIKIHL